MSTEIENTELDPPYMYYLRAMLELTARRDNLIANRLLEMQDVLLQIKQANNLADVKAVIPDSFLPTITKNKRETRDEFIALLSSGEGNI